VWTPSYWVCSPPGSVSMSLSDMICVGCGELDCVYDLCTMKELWRLEVCKMLLENVLGAMTDARGSFNAYDVMSNS
jgi:hypothetical protein